MEPESAQELRSDGHAVICCVLSLPELLEEPTSQGSRGGPPAVRCRDRQRRHAEGRAARPVSSVQMARRSRLHALTGEGATEIPEESWDTTASMTIAQLTNRRGRPLYERQV